MESALNENWGIIPDQSSCERLRNWEFAVNGVIPGECCIPHQMRIFGCPRVLACGEDYARIIKSTVNQHALCFEVTAALES